MMAGKRNAEKWLKDLYTGKGRDFKTLPPEDTGDLPFFDPRYRKLAARWYRVRFGAEEASDSPANGREESRTRL